MADKTPTNDPDEPETRKAQLSRIVAWTEQSPKRVEVSEEEDEPRQEAEAS